MSRIAANWKYYHAPLSIVNHFESVELPHLMNVTGLLPEPVVSTRRRTKQDDELRIDLSPIKDFNLTLCYGKEWYRFPGHYLVPEGVRVEFIKSEFEGLLPGHFSEEDSVVASPWWIRPQTRAIPQDQNDLNKEEPSHYVRLFYLFHFSCSVHSTFKSRLGFRFCLHASDRP